MKRDCLAMETKLMLISRPSKSSVSSLRDMRVSTHKAIGE